eukprot:3099319-Amphidinium_carterae.1
MIGTAVQTNNDFGSVGREACCALHDEESPAVLYRYKQRAVKNRLVLFARHVGPCAGLLPEDMLKQLEKEAEDDEEIYEKMACWCETNDKEKTQVAWFMLQCKHLLWRLFTMGGVRI